MSSVALVLVSAAVQFPPWPSVTPATMLQEVPAFEYVGVPGSVRKIEKTEALPESCAIREGGKVVGYRLSCP